MVWQPPKDIKPFIVCAAIRDPDTKLIITGARHFDMIMHGVLKVVYGEEYPPRFDQGFIDQWGRFWSRTEAMKLAKDGGQKIDIERGCGGSHQFLYSEGLY